MGIQADAARDLEAAAGEVVEFIDQCPDHVWHRRVEAEGRTVGELAYHCAMGNDVALGWICQLMAVRPVYETSPTHDAFNAAEAARGGRATKAEVAEAVRRTTARTASFLRALTEEELERSAVFGIIGQERSVGRFIPNFARHMRGHLESMKTALDS